jgi:hypothetical protein
VMQANACSPQRRPHCWAGDSSPCAWITGWAQSVLSCEACREPISVVAHALLRDPRGQWGCFQFTRTLGPSIIEVDRDPIERERKACTRGMHTRHAHKAQVARMNRCAGDCQGSAARSGDDAGDVYEREVVHLATTDAMSAHATTGAANHQRVTSCG